MVEVHVTFPNLAEASAVCQQAVERRLAACANISSPIRSVYWWDGAIQSGDEVAVVLKTADAVADALVAFLAGAHSYDVPAIIVPRPAQVGKAYADWVDRETRGGPDGAGR